MNSEYRVKLQFYIFENSAAENSYLVKIIRKGLVDTKQDIEVQRKDPNSPLHYIKTFGDLRL